MPRQSRISVSVRGVLQFSHSFSDRLARQDNPHPHFLHIQFHYSNYMRIFPRFVLSGRWNPLTCSVRKLSILQPNVLRSVFNIAHFPESPEISKSGISC